MKNDYEVRGDITAIFLKRKDGTIIETIIDTLDLPRAQEFPMTWYANWSDCINSFYVFGNTPIVDGKRTNLKLHRWLINATEKELVDHINHDTLDNRRSINLRTVTDAENKQNLKSTRANNSSGNLNVYWCSQKERWLVKIMIDKKPRRFGFFRNIQDARDKAKEMREKHLPYSQEYLKGVETHAVV